MCVAPSHFSKILIILALAQQKASISTSSSPSTSSQVPLRVRFARAENDFQKRRREQSALYKQKQVEQDQWIPLRVEQAVRCSPFPEYIHSFSSEDYEAVQTRNWPSHSRRKKRLYSVNS